MIFRKYSKSITKWAFWAYIVWSVIADLIILTGAVYWIFFN